MNRRFLTVLLVLAAVALLGLGLVVALDTDEEGAAADELVARGAEECAERLPGRVGEVRIGDLPPRELERARRRMARAGARFTDQTKFAFAHWPGGARALITMLPVPPGHFDTDEAREDVAEGALMGAAAQGIVGDRIKIAGIPLVHYKRGPEHLVVASLDCHVTYIAAPSQRHGLGLARGLLRRVSG
ncbi:MAG TPA: hypothetical protein VIL04_03760 [Solirubrobacterales bacterium]